MLGSYYENIYAKRTAQELFNKYSFGEPSLGHLEIGSVLRDLYSSIGIAFLPTNDDIKGLMRVMDIDSDGRISLQDLQTKAIACLCGNDVVSFRRRYNSKTQAKLVTLSTIFDQWVRGEIKGVQSLASHTRTIVDIPLEQLKEHLRQNSIKSYGDYEKAVLSLLEKKGEKLYQQ